MKNLKLKFHFFRDISITKKLIIIIVLITGIMLLLSSSLFFIYEMINFKQTAIERLQSLAKVVGTNSTGALLFNDKKLAEKTLAALKAEPDIQAAVLYSNNFLFARYISPEYFETIPEKAPPSGIFIESSRFIVVESIILDDEQIGQIYLVAGLDRFYEKLWVYAFLIVIVIVILMVVTIVLSSRLQRIISSPILNLAQLAEKVSKDKDYSLRANKQSNDEFGSLTEGINQMLSGIQIRDEELTKLNRMLKMLSRSDEILVRAKNELTFLQDVCKIIIEIGNYHMVWIGFAQNDEFRTVQPVSFAGYEEEYLKSIKISWGENEYGLGPTGMAIRNKRTVIFDDLHSNSAFLVWSQEALKRNYKSSIAIPLLFNDQVFGALNIYSNISKAFESEEVNLLTELANDISYGLMTIRTREEHRKAEEALIQSEGHFRLLVENAPVAMVVASENVQNGMILLLNKKFIELFGYAIEDLPDIEHWWQIAYPEETYRETIKHFWTESLKTVSEFSIIKPVETKITCKDGTQREIEFHLSKIGDKNLVTFIDLTERKQSELQLVQAQKMETIGMLAGGIAHDFNNILGGIIGTLSLLQHKRKRNKLTEPDLDKYINTIEKASQDATDVVNQLLTLSRKKELSVRPFDLNPLINDVTKICENSIDKSIEIKTIFYEKEAVSLIDPVQMEHVLLNLCINASQAMTIMRKEGVKWGGSLNISIKSISADKYFSSIHKVPENSRYWIISVSDTGVGIDHSVRLKIFDPFFTTEKKGKGTGLGLTMAYNIIKQHKGLIDVFSAIGVGSTFNVYLPMYEGEIVHTEETSKENLIMGEGLILVIDDEEIIRTIAKGILEECGYDVILATDGIEGVEIFKQNIDKIKAVVLDLVMPKKSGKETFIDLKELKPDVKVLLASGFKQDERVTSLLEMGVIDFMQKPYTISEMSKKIYGVLNSSIQK